MPYTELAKADHQMSFYAATKKATEAMVHSYAHLFGLPVTMFRFFTVYGPWGRPDMALFKFTRAILAGEPIDVYIYGDMSRDFTYVSDLVAAIRLLIDVVPVRPVHGVVPEGDSLSPVAPWRVVNIGNTEPVQLTDFIAAIEAATGKVALRNLMDMQPGDVPYKCGSHSTDKEFKRLLTRIVEEDQAYQHIPDYGLRIDGEKVVFTNRRTMPALLLEDGISQLDAEALHEARVCAPGWDVHYLEREWRQWCAKQEIMPKHPESHFLAFCRSWAEKRGWPS